MILSSWWYCCESFLFSAASAMESSGGIPCCFLSTPSVVSRSWTCVRAIFSSRRKSLISFIKVTFSWEKTMTLVTTKSRERSRHRFVPACLFQVFQLRMLCSVSPSPQPASGRVLTGFSSTGLTRRDEKGSPGSRGYSLSESWGRNHGRRGSGAEVGPSSPRARNLWNPGYEKVGRNNSEVTVTMGRP